MATARRFEELDGWQWARKLTANVYRVTQREPTCRDFGFCGQFTRASVSIMNNIAEGFERDGRREFLQFLFVAKGSAGEVRSQLYVALDLGYIDQPEFEDLLVQCETTIRLIAGLIRYLRQTDHDGLKHKPSQTDSPPPLET